MTILSIRFSLMLWLGGMLSGMLLVSAYADQLVTTEFQVTTTPNPTIESIPRIGADLSSRYVVYMKYELGPSGVGPGDIFFQRMSDTGLIGPAIRITPDDVLDEALPDVDGTFIVYTAFESTSSQQGRIMLYQISTGLTRAISNLAQIREPRIQDNHVVWVEGPLGATTIQLFDLSTLGSGLGSTTIAGPNPLASDPEIGSRFIVWEELDDTSVPGQPQYNVRAYDLITGLTVDVAVNPTLHERFPSTSGSWIVWQAHDLVPAGSPQQRTVGLFNVDTGERRTIVDIVQTGNAPTFFPSIDGDIVAWESDITGNWEVYLYRLSTGETFQVTDRPGDQRLNYVFQNKIVWVEVEEDPSNLDVFTATFSFVPDAQPDIDVAPAALNFGNVEQFSSQSGIVTILNVVPDADLMLQGVALASGGTGDFAITTAPVTPLVIPPNGSVDVEITFTPSAEGTVADGLQITSDDPDESVVTVNLSGTGIFTEVPPSEQIANILDFIDAAVLEGTLEGNGNGNSAGNRLNALTNMIEAAGDLVAQGQIVEACDQLASAFQKTDGLPKPPDFVIGASAAELASRIQDLRNDLGCQ